VTGIKSFNFGEEITGKALGDFIKFNERGVSYEF
jgi:hypothetical protein